MGSETFAGGIQELFLNHVLYRKHTTGICGNENSCQKNFILGKKTHLPSCANRPINFSIAVSKHMKFRIIFLRHLLLEIPVYPTVPMKKPVNVTHLSEARAGLCDLMLTSLV